ncbi:MAG: chemotaxis protein CheW [Deltaproteobacteria bacterium]|nr:chemotaxis protein CheW [Deltaproteobacteria bacterium]
MDIAEIRKKARKLKEEATDVEVSTFVKEGTVEKDNSEEAELEQMQAELEAKAAEEITAELKAEATQANEEAELEQMQAELEAKAAEEIEAELKAEATQADDEAELEQMQAELEAKAAEEAEIEAKLKAEACSINPIDELSALIEEATEESAESEEDGDDEEREEEFQAISFTLDDEEYAIEVKHIKEIITIKELTDVPKAPPGILGVLSLRGAVIPVMNLKSRLGLNQDESGNRIIIVNDKDELLGLLVDTVKHVIRFTASHLEDAPSLNTINEDLISAIGRHGDSTFILIDIEQLLEKV